MYSIGELIGRNSKAVERILGIPLSTEVVKTSGALEWTKAYYCGGEIEIIYIDQVADWITVHNQQNKPIEEFIDFLGLRILKLNLRYYGTVKYFNICGLKQVCIIGDQVGQTQTLFIKAFTEAK